MTDLSPAVLPDLSEHLQELTCGILSDAGGKPGGKAFVTAVSIGLFCGEVLIGGVGDRGNNGKFKRRILFDVHAGVGEHFIGCGHKANAAKLTDIQFDRTLGRVAMAGNDAAALVQVTMSMDKYKRDQLQPILQQWLELLQSALAGRCGMDAVSPLARNLGTARSPRELMDAISRLQKAIEYAQSNVSPAAVCGYLAWELR